MLTVKIDYHGHTVPLKNAVRDKYAWPGGYEMALIMDDSATLCMDCAKAEFKEIVRATKHGDNTGWRAEGVFINYEDQSCYCAHCGRRIDPAYGD